MFPGDENLEFKFTMEHEGAKALEDAPFHILVLGDWIGSSSPSGLNETQSQTLEIDRDNFDEVLTNLNVNLELSIEQQENINIQFSKLDDFHPDNLFRKVAVFSDLREMRRRLSRPDTFEKAAQEVRSWLEDDKTLLPKLTPTKKQIKNFSSEADLLDSILSKPEQNVSGETTQVVENTELNKLIGKLVKPFLIETDENEQSNLITAVDEAASDLMRKILHHPRFKELESAWRGLFYLVRNVETDSLLKIFILNLNKENLAFLLKSEKKSENFNFFNILENNKNWAVICGNYNFQININDVATLLRLAAISNALDTPFVSYLEPANFESKQLKDISEFKDLLFSSNSPECKLWNAIRADPKSESIGLLFQRLLIRIPFGADTDPAETFSFEEISEIAQYNEYLWTNPCFILAVLLAQSFSLNHWNLPSNFSHDIEGLPTPFFSQADGKESVPKSEFVLNHSLCEAFLELGLMPIVTFQNNDALRLPRIQSIAFPNKQLKGKWK